MTTTIWLTGLPSSGKTTLARAIVERRGTFQDVEHLDGDVLRREMFPELGFDRADRMENIRRTGEIAAMLARHHVLAVVSVIAPYGRARDNVRAAHEARGLTFIEVHVDAPAEVCAARDVKGLYAGARQGRVTGLTGAGDPYEPPVAPDVRVDTSRHGVHECVLSIERTFMSHERHGEEALT